MDYYKIFHIICQQIKEKVSIELCRLMSYNVKQRSHAKNLAQRRIESLLARLDAVQGFSCGAATHRTITHKMCDCAMAHGLACLRRMA